MITANFEDFPDHRINFFKLLRAINSKAFGALLELDQPQFELVMHSISWAFKHLDRTNADTGLNIMLELIKNVQKSKVANLFYTTYFITILQNILDVMCDTFHKAGFKLQAQILAELFNIVETGAITVPLWQSSHNPTNQQYANNQIYVREFTTELLRRSFQNLSANEVQGFVQGLFQLNTDQARFKGHLRDFLVKLKEYNVNDSNDELFREEKEAQAQAQQQMESERLKAVPGLEYHRPQLSQMTPGEAASFRSHLNID